MKRKIAAVTLVCGLVPILALGQGAGGPQQTRGQSLYAEHCASCHGADGQAGAGFQTPIWGASTQIGKFGNAQGLFEYLQLFMPFDDPSRLTDEQKWAITAFMLRRHGALPGNQALSAQNATGVPIR